MYSILAPTLPNHLRIALAVNSGHVARPDVPAYSDCQPGNLFVYVPNSKLGRFGVK